MAASSRTRSLLGVAINLVTDAIASMVSVAVPVGPASRLRNIALNSPPSAS
jgi:hypothetical protein